MPEIELTLFECFCGVKFMGYLTDYDQHLQTECPVFALALKKLSTRA